MQYGNRSTEFTVEFSDNAVMTFMIDGKEVIKVQPWQKVNRRMLVKGLWDIDPESFKNQWEDRDLFPVSFHEKPKKKPMKVNVVANKEFLRRYGVNPKQVVPVVNAIAYKMAILPYKDYYKLFKTPNSVNPVKFLNVINSFEMLEQAKADGIMNITPFIAAERMSPQELKKKYGKSLWKKLCANTLHRNLALVQDYYGDWRGGEGVVQAISNKIKIDTTALYMKHDNPLMLQWMKDNKILSYAGMKDGGEVYYKWRSIYADTQSMSRQLDLPFNNEWTPRKMKEKHDEYAAGFAVFMEKRRARESEEYRKELERREAIDLSSVYPVLEWEHSGVKATLLTTYKQVVEEGSSMHHCVGNYGGRAVEMQYAVVHLESVKEKTTLGLNVTKYKFNEDFVYRFEFGQHCGVCNDPVNSEAHRELRDIVIKSLNDAKIKVKKENE